MDGVVKEINMSVRQNPNLSLISREERVLDPSRLLFVDDNYGG